MRIFEPTATIAELRLELERAMFEGFRQTRNARPEEFRLLEQSLTGPFAEAIERRSSRTNHYAFLVRGFTQQPVFGQESSGITVSQLYVRQRCTWDRVVTQAKAETDEADAEDLAADDGGAGAHSLHQLHLKGRKTIRRISDLHSLVDAWLRDRDPSDPVRVIAGGPGSGKSTFARALAIETADTGEYDVLYIPLQELEPAGNFENRIANLFRVRTELGFDRVDSPLSWMGQREQTGSPPTKPLLLICDGLDEIAPPDTLEATSATTDFIQALNIWLGHRNSGGCFARAVVLGRTIAAEDAFRKLNIDSSAVLSVAGLLPLAYSNRRSSITIEDPEELCDIDQRSLYWENWCTATGEVNRILPPALGPSTSVSLAIRELTAEPLLLYLLLWTGYLVQRWEEAADNRNIVYQEIFSRIYNRDWGPTTYNEKSNRRQSSGGHPGTREISASDFFSLQEALGLASWPSGARVVASENFVSTARAYLSADQFEDLVASAEGSLKSVALQSYTRTAGNQDDGFEFVHKTLGEYLIGRALANTLIASLVHLEGRSTDARCEAAAKRISQICCSGYLTAEIARFFVDEVRLRCRQLGALERALSDKIVPLVNWVMRNGLPVHQVLPVNTGSFEALERTELRGLDVLWTFSQAVAGMVYPFPDDERALPEWTAGPLKIVWPKPHSFTSLIRRLTDRSHCSETKRICSFRFLDLSQQVLTDTSFGCVLFSVDENRLRPDHWLSVNLSGSSLRGTNLAGSNLRRARLAYCDLTDARLSGAELFGAVLHYADFSGAFIERVRFDAARMQKAKFVGSRILGSSFRRTELTGANFEKASIAPSRMVPSSLGVREANIFLETIFNDCNFFGCNILGALFGKCSFIGANFERATLRSTQFVETSISQAVMKKTRMSEASAMALGLAENAGVIVSRSVSMREDDQFFQQILISKAALKNL